MSVGLASRTGNKMSGEELWGGGVSDNLALSALVRKMYTPCFTCGGDFCEDRVVRKSNYRKMMHSIITGGTYIMIVLCNWFLGPCN
jgi:hypothetical protein